MEQKKAGLTISFIDKERRTAYMEYDGCPITLSFTKQSNPEVKDLLKEVLIGSMLNHAKESQNCVSA